MLGSASVATVNGGSPPIITCPAGGPFLLDTGEYTIGPAGVDASPCGLDEDASTLSGILTTESVGPQGVTFTAVDLCGYSASLTCSYDVIYDFSGFSSPVHNAPALNATNSGSKVPVKFSLYGYQGLAIMGADSPASQQVACDTLEPIGDSQPTAGKLNYSKWPDQYIYIWKTDKAWVGTCRVLTVTLSDNTEHLAYFIFR